MKTVAEILKSKGREVWTITPETIVFDALKTMADKNVGALVVLDRTTVIGILSERDYARKVILHGKSSKELRTREIMSANVYFVGPDQNIEDCMALFTTVIAEQESTIKHLENYITGGR